MLILVVGVTAQSTPLQDTSANATGTATWFRVINGSTNAVIDGSVGTASADLVLNSTSIAIGQTVTISSWTFTMPET
jgi:hypothetical protein